MGRVVVGDGSLSRDGFREGEAAALGELSRPFRGLRVVHPAPAEQEGPPRPAEAVRRGGDLGAVRTRTPDPVEGFGEEFPRIVEGLLLGVLAQSQENRAALRRVEEGGHRLRQGAEELLGPGDPVPVTGDRPEGVVHAHGRVAEILDLLEDGIRPPRGEHIPAEEENGQPVGVGEGGRGHHVRRAGPDRGGRHHALLPPPRLRVRDRREGHGLLVLAPPGRQAVPLAVQGFPEASDIPMTKDRKDTRKVRHYHAVDFDALRTEIPHERLGHGESLGGGCHELGDAGVRGVASMWIDIESSVKSKRNRLHEESRLQRLLDPQSPSP